MIHNALLTKGRCQEQLKVLICRTLRNSVTKQVPAQCDKAQFLELTRNNRHDENNSIFPRKSDVWFVFFLKAHSALKVGKMRDSCLEEVASDLDIYKDRFEFLGLKERIGPGDRGTQGLPG